MRPSGSARIAVVGAGNWLNVASHLLHLAKLDGVPVRASMTRLLWCWPWSREFRSASAVHMVWGGHTPLTVLAGLLLRKRIIWHWIGTDALWYARGRGVAHWLRRWAATHIVSAHVADSPDLATELGTSGIQASVCRLLPASIEAAVEPLPQTFRVLSYWFDEKRAFYGGDLILAAARRMPHVEFLIAGARGVGAQALPNVRFLGRVENMDAVYRDTSVFLRLPEHDSLSAMVLEALARGRYVICNRDLPCCRRADTLEQLLSALDEVRRVTEPNRDGAAYVREHFRLQDQADSLSRLYSELTRAR